jgi:tRNA(fMet)-specific endonuclease VapC
VRYLLDTNTCVYVLKRRSGPLQRLRGLTPDDVAVSTVTLAELWFGARKSSRPDRTRAAVDAFLKAFAVLPFDRAAADEYARVRLELEVAGKPIGERDLLISAIALSRRLIVVTHNVREFARVPGARVEDWY